MNQKFLGLVKSPEPPFKKGGLPPFIKEGWGGFKKVIALIITCIVTQCNSQFVNKLRLIFKNPSRIVFQCCLFFTDKV